MLVISTVYGNVAFGAVYGRRIEIPTVERSDGRGVGAGKHSVSESSPKADSALRPKCATAPASKPGYDYPIPIQNRYVGAA